LESFKNVQFWVVGDGVERKYLEDLSKELKVDKHIKFLGRIDNDKMPEILNSSDIYVSTSLSDSMAISNLEAMGCGLPVIISGIGDNSEWVQDNKNGFLFHAKDYRALTKEIVHLLKNPDLRKEFGLINRKIVQKADYYKQMENMEKIYEGMIK
jgi:glycosyltransferase involved in cell wall biosynthesis